MWQCHVSGLIKLELHSLIKSNKHYSVHGVYVPLEKGRNSVSNNDKVLFPKISITVPSSSQATDCAAHHQQKEQPTRRLELGKGSNILYEVRKHLQSQENWIPNISTSFWDPTTFRPYSSSTTLRTSPNSHNTIKIPYFLE